MYMKVYIIGYEKCTIWCTYMGIIVRFRVHLSINIVHYNVQIINVLVA